MKIDKRMMKLINKMVQASFDKKSQLVESQVKEYTKILTKLPRVLAIIYIGQYLKEIKTLTAKTVLEIESAIPLSPDEISKITSRLEKNNTINSIEQKINPSLLGGIRVKIGDVVYDSSVYKRIEQVKGAIVG